MKINRDSIRLETADRRTLARGEEYFHSKKIKQASATTMTDGGWKLNAIVRGSSLYKVEVSIDKDGDILDSYCNCAAWATRPGLCKHCVAALLMAAEHFEGQQMQTLDDASRKNRASERDESDYTARQLLDAYLKQEEPLPAEDQQPIHLLPVIHFSPETYQSYLTFSIGSSRMYVVKDVDELKNAFNTHARVSYGKLLSFIHDDALLDEDSRALLQLIRRNDEQSLLRQRIWHSDKKYFILSPSLFEALFELYKGKTMKATWAYASTGYANEKRLSSGDRKANADDDERFLDNENLYFIGEEPVITLHITKRAQSGICLSCDDKPLPFANRRLYFSRNNLLYRLDEDSSGKLRALLGYIAQGGGSLSFNASDTSAFCSSVLPALPACVKLDDPDHLLEHYLPELVQCHVFLDAPARSLVKCQAVAEYPGCMIDLDNGRALAIDSDGNAAYLSNPTPPSGCRRDARAEQRLLSYVRQLVPPGDNGQMCAEGDDTIYELLTGGVQLLQTVATVHISDRLKRYIAAPSVKAQFSVRLESNLLKLDIDIDQFPMDELAAVLAAYRERRRYYRLKDGQYLAIDESSSALNDLSTLSEGLQLSDKELLSGHTQIPAFRAMYLDGFFREENRKALLRKDPAYKGLVRTIKNAMDSDYEVPSFLQPVLRSYQEAGYRWFRTLEECQFCGILADDMGLGKTVQLLAVLTNHYQEQHDGLPSIIVCPASLILNWKAEFTKFAPQLSVRMILGSAAVRQELIASVCPDEILVTSYDLIRRDMDSYAAMRFHYCVIDEAQYIKNHTTKSAQAVKSINCVQRFALTGTPIENRLSELWSIFDFLMPGYLFSYNRFKQRFELPVVKSGDEKARAQLRRMISPFVLRRLKRDVLPELPPKVTTVLPVELQDEQRKLYLAASISGLKQLKASAEPDAGSYKLKILALLTRLRQLCCDPALCYEGYSGGSAKLDTCMELVEEAQNGGHKLLLFSQFTSMLAIIENRLKEMNVSYMVLQGSTPKEQRVSMADRFNTDDTTVFLISLKAGGTGLNLIGADMVIHYDPWWNLAAQEQATDRAYRIGQTKSLQIYKLIAAGTIEEKILALQERKGDLASIIDGDGEATAMSADQLLSLLEEGAG